jgi:nicotinamidase/pyrazinamidase
MMPPQPHDALLVIDVPGGALAVPDGDAVVPVINQLAPHFDHVLLTQDWHPANHISFAANHAGAAPYETIDLPYGKQVLWPTHCVQGSAGADFAPGLTMPHAELVIRKGFRRNVDSYSAFQEADRQTPTGLAGYLRERGLTRLFLCGLATDFCVAWSALDARTSGFDVWVIEDACRAIDLDESLARAWRDMEQAGVLRVSKEAVLF